jgi:hypothetical protein
LWLPVSYVVWGTLRPASSPLSGVPDHLHAAGQLRPSPVISVIGSHPQKRAVPSGQPLHLGRFNVRRLNVRQHIVILSALLVGLWGLAPQAAQAAPAVCTGSCLALINGDTVTGSPSVEQTLATAAGFTVTVVSGPVWDAMTAADFAAYRVLIAGDPTCHQLAISFTSNSSTWAPVVMGTSVNTAPGNRILIGTDPVYHRGLHPGADKLIQDGIAFAGTLSGRTGLYFDATCYDDIAARGVRTIATLAKLSAGAGAWTENPVPPCGGSVSLIASNAAFSDLTSADLQGWSCSDHETFPTFPDDWNALAVATDTPTKPTCGSDPGGPIGNTVCGEAYILISGTGTVVIAPNITLTPADATNPVGGTHTVTACLFTGVSCGLSPIVGQLVVFTITGVNAGVSGICAPVTCVTGLDGNVTFTYTDTKGAGDDTIIASFTAGIPPSTQQASAAKHWKTIEQPITATGTTFTATEGQLFSATVATFTDPTPAATSTEYTATIDWGDLTPISTGTVSGPIGGTFTVTGSHIYAEEGTYKVTVTIIDVDNAANNATVTSTANVADAALTASPACLTNSQQSYSGPTATFTDASSTGTLSDFSASINWGDTTISTGVIAGGPGNLPYTVSGTHTYATTGNHTITTTITDVGGSTASVSCNTLAFSFAPGGGSFVIGDNGTHSWSVNTVTFWGAQWAKDNSLSGGKAPNSFKGFAENPTTPTCGAVWSADPGNSTPPPAGPLPDFMAVIVTSSADQSGSTISGNIVHIVIVKTNPGYEPNPGHAGTGTVVAVVC